MHCFMSVQVRYWETDTTMKWMNTLFLYFAFLGVFYILQSVRYGDALLD